MIFSFLQATALHLGRNIMVVGTINSGPGDRGYTTLEGGPGADAYPPLYVGYYQDQHYQSLQRTELPACLDLASGAADLRTVAAMGKEMGLAYLPPTIVSDQVIWRNAEDEQVRERSMYNVRQRFVAVELMKQVLYGVIEEVARVGILREVPLKRVQEARTLSKKEQGFLEESQLRLDRMISQLNLRMPDQPNQERLEIFQRLGKAETIVEYGLSVSQGLVITPLKHKNGNLGGKPQRTALAPLQLSMGRQVTPTKYKGGSTGREEDPKLAVVVKAKEEKASVGNIYTCIKCDQAFEKINLFVKHFIQNHKDVINANRNSKNFSFSNYWTKSKKGGGKIEEEKEEGAEEGHKNLNNSKKGDRDGELSVTGAGDWDLQMECQLIPTAKSANKRANVRKTSKIPSVHKENFFSQPVEAFSAVYAVELDEEVEQAEEVLPIDSFQCVPLKEIKVENPFEELPFNWEGEVEDVLEEKYLKEEGLLKVLDIQDEEEVEEILGPTRSSELAVGVIIDDILGRVFSKKEMELGEDVEELFNEELLDTNLEVVRHQVFIKDFFWVPLEDQFLHCDIEEKTQAETLLLLRKLKDMEELREEVKTLMLGSSDEDMTTQLVLRILGEDALPLKADHGQALLASSKLVVCILCFSFDDLTLLLRLLSTLMSRGRKPRMYLLQSPGCLQGINWLSLVK